jgi:hypothetical protein
VQLKGGRIAPLRAFRTVACGITTCVFAESHSKARYVTYQSARSAGFDVRLINIIVRRWPEMDAAGFRRGCWCPEHVRRVVTETNRNRHQDVEPDNDDTAPPENRE